MWAKLRPLHELRTRRSRRFPRRVPSSVYATLLGIALTAWLLPAFTRQWDDRQKAHDLKAAMVADMAAATARALGEASASAATPRTIAERRDDWLVASAKVGARLHAYFPARDVAAWQLYSYFVHRALGVSDVLADATLERVVNWLYREQTDVRPHESLDLPVAGAAWVAIRFLELHEHRVKPTYFSTQRAWLTQALPSKDDLLPHATKELERLQPLRARELDERLRMTQLWDFEEIVAGSALKSHLNGFSTTAGDFFHDLIP